MIWRTLIMHLQWVWCHVTGFTEGVIDILHDLYTNKTMAGAKVFHLQFGETFYEVRILNGVIQRINEYYATNQFEREVKLDELPREVKLAVIDEVIALCDEYERPTEL